MLADDFAASPLASLSGALALGLCGADEPNNAVHEPSDDGAQHECEHEPHENYSERVQHVVVFLSLNRRLFMVESLSPQ